MCSISCWVLAASVRVDFPPRGYLVISPIQCVFFRKRPKNERGFSFESSGWPSNQGLAVFLKMARKWLSVFHKVNRMVKKLLGMMGCFLISPSRISALYGSFDISTKLASLPTKENLGRLRFGEGTTSLCFVPLATSIRFLYISFGTEVWIVGGGLYCAVRRAVSMT